MLILVIFKTIQASMVKIRSLQHVINKNLGLMLHILHFLGPLDTCSAAV